MDPTAADAADYLTRVGRHDLASAVHLALAELEHLRADKRTTADDHPEIPPTDTPEGNPQ